MPDGTMMIETSQAIITPRDISKPNSCTILIDVVVSAINPMDVVILVKNITFDICNIVRSSESFGEASS